MLEFVKLAGAPVVMMDANPDRLEFCRREMGVEKTVSPSAEIDRDLRRLCDGNLPDVVFDATGSAASMSAAFGFVAPGGKLVFVGITTDEVTFRHPTFHRPEGTLLCSRNALPEDFDRIIGLVESGKIDTKPWITHREPFAEIAGRFPTLCKPETRVVKAIIELE